MEPDRACRAWEVFSCALERPPQERGVFVGVACAGDDELRSSVQALLEDEERSRSFLHAPLVQCPETGSNTHAGVEYFAALTPGTRVDRYTIVRTMGRGGMGVVFEASQGHPERTVALKFLRGSCVSPESVHRFVNEARLLARLQHPGIAQVYDAGMYILAGERSVPYCVLEYVAEPLTIVEYCRTHAPEVRERLGQLAQVCDAVHHAHQRGVIHRDLKPANIIVGTSGTPKVIDFGVARMLEEDGTTAMHTHAGAVVGTLAYMPPEQCAGNPADVGVRSDVYALGAVLYELLCGRPPHDLRGLSLPQAVHRLCEEPIPRPSTIDPAASGDLEVILLRALEREAASRYESAAALADDIRRYLESRPIAARRIGAVYRGRMFARRHPWSAAMAAAAFGGLVITGGAIGVTMNQRVLSQRKERLAEETLGVVVKELMASGAGVFAEGLTPGEARSSKAVALFATATGEGSLIQLRNRSGVVASEVPTFLPPPGLGDDNDFVFGSGLLADVFPADPGREFVAVFNELQQDPGDEHKLRVLRVYDLNLSVRREIWLPADFRSMVWDAQSGQLILAMAFNDLQYCRPSLAAYDARWCCDRPAQVSLIMAIQPSESGDGVLFSMTPELQDTLIRPTWAFARVPRELEDPSSAYTVHHMEVSSADPGVRGAACKVLAMFSTEGHPGQFQPSPRFLAAAHLDASGHLIEPFQFIDGGSVSQSKQLFAEFERIDLPTAAHGATAAAAICSECTTFDEAQHAIRTHPTLPASAVESALSAAQAMMSNWRWLDRQASTIVEIQVPSDEPSDLNRALEWARRAALIHDSRCPDPTRCRASWYVRDTLAFALYRNQLHEEALQVALDNQELWRTEFPSPPFGSGDSLEVALEAMCLHQLGRFTEAAESLQDAINARSNSDVHGGLTDRVLAEAIDLVEAARSGEFP